MPLNVIIIIIIIKYIVVAPASCCARDVYVGIVTMPDWSVKYCTGVCVCAGLQAAEVCNIQ